MPALRALRVLMVAAVASAAATVAVAAETPRRVPLADTRMASTEASRQTLKYLASCALPEDVVLTATHAGVDYEFPGGIGLAPGWQERGMGPEEQRWVSACMLARTNFYGVRVEISLRSDFPSEAPGLRIWRDEDAAFTQEEGTFFGNLFAERPVAWVCGPAHDASARARIAARKRLCALRPEGAPAEGQATTACHFVHVGPCTADAFTQEGVGYRQAITVFLQP